jgi:signal transduction histidine kinase
MTKANPMRRTPSWIKRRALAIGFLAAAIPLAVLLVLQWVWLGRLEETSRIAQRSAHYLMAESLVGEVEAYYRGAAERVLEPPGADEDLRTAYGRRWARGPFEGVRTLFLVDYGAERFGNVLRWDVASGRLVTPPASDEALAIIVACTPWQMASYHQREIGAMGFLVDERDPAHRIVLAPIRDDHAHILGVAGMVLDEEFLMQALLPRALQQMRDRLAVRVRDAKGREVLAFGGPEGKVAVERRFPWVFSDWTLTVSGGDDAERWARAGFTFNMTLAVLLAATLLGGLVFALRAAGRAVELSEMKSGFVSNVSHELRTPLASIRTFGELLKLGRASPERIQDYGAHIEAESRRLSRLIDNLLDFSRIESGRKEYRFVEARLEDVVARAIEAFDVRTREDGFEIRYRPPAEPLPSITMDPDAVSQAVHNLIENAVKYSGSSRRIEIGLGVENGWAVCSVRDWGIGIPRDEQRRIFERFHRVGSALVHDVKGTGLGLSIVQHVVRAHRGEARVESEVGRGTTVSLLLPTGPAPAGLTDVREE